MTSVDMKHLPDSFSLPKAWLKAGLLLAISVAFVVGGITLARDGNNTGVLIAAFFGICAVVFIGALISRAGVDLDREGLTIRSLFTSHRYAWRDVSEFSHRRVGRAHM